MIKHIATSILVLALVACSGDSSNGGDTGGGNTNAGETGGDNTGGNNTGGETGGDNTGGDNTGGDNTGGSVTPSGGIPGVWVGQNNFGEAVMVVDNAQNIYAFAAEGGDYEAVFGAASGPLRAYDHRDSTNPASNDSFTLVGSVPRALQYNLQVSNEGQQIDNTGAAGNFIMNLADLNDVQPLSVADAAGNWAANSSFDCADPGPFCDLQFLMSISADGSMSGSIRYQQFEPIAMVNPSVSAAANSTQFLTVSFDWNGVNRSGVIYRYRTDPTRLVLITDGPNESTTNSMSALLTRQ